jgi:4-carboxymuconolactone decarboxylase
MNDLPEGSAAIGRIMGRSADSAAVVLEEMYGEAIAREVLGIGRIWEREVLTRRERSFVAIAALATLGTLERLRIHVGGALNHGATPQEIEEVILTLMVYAGHGRATEAIEVVRAVVRERTS